MANEELRRIVLDASRTYAGPVCIGVITVAQADAILEAIEAAGYVLAPAEWFARQQRALRCVKMTGPVWLLGEAE
jgi:hypothetical protein